MHAEAFAYVEQFATDDVLTVLDIGGRNVNGSVRDLFPHADYTALDILPGEGVDIVANAASWTPDRAYDLIVCTEVFEHTDQWPQILEVAAAACRPGGRLVLTMAGPGRPEHSAIDGGPRRPDEHYGNVAPEDLQAGLLATGWVEVTVEYRTSPADTRATATRPAEAV